ncbi:hypothetical protein D3C78_315140 [compost metagenome]
MNTLSLSPAGRPYLAEQATQNGTFTHLLRDQQGMVRESATLIIEQCDEAISVRVEIGDGCHSITLRRGDDAGERIARFVEFIANGEQDYSVPVQDDLELISDVERMLREAIRLGRGTHCLYMEDDFDLCLCLRPALSDLRRALFCFELNGVSLTLWLMLPADRQVAYELLSGCVQELVANYRSSAAA